MLNFLEKNCDITEGCKVLSIHTPNRQHYNALMTMCYNNSIKWAGVLAVTNFDAYDIYEHQTVVFFTKHKSDWQLSYAKIDYALKQNYSIFTINNLTGSGSNLDISELI